MDEHAALLQERGYRLTEPRRVIIAALRDAGRYCTATQLYERLRGRAVGLASVYRTLELLAELGLVQRFDVGEGVARYEPALPSGEHHHHLVCDRCGRVAAFEDQGVERSLASLARRLEIRVEGHDVVLRGTCVDCVAATAGARD